MTCEKIFNELKIDIYGLLYNIFFAFTSSTHFIPSSSCSSYFWVFEDFMSHLRIRSREDVVFIQLSLLEWILYMIWLLWNLLDNHTTGAWIFTALWRYTIKIESVRVEKYVLTLKFIHWVVLEFFGAEIRRYEIYKHCYNQF